MGHSVTCNFHVEIFTKNHSISSLYGAMTFKDVRGLILSESSFQADKGRTLEKVVIFSQTKTGERYLKGYDYMKVNPSTFEKSYHRIGDDD